MAIWQNTLVNGALEVANGIYLDDNAYNVASIHTDNGSKYQYIGDTDINTKINGASIKLDSPVISLQIRDGWTVGTSAPSNAVTQEGRIYFRIID